MRKTARQLLDEAKGDRRRTLAVDDRPAGDGRRSAAGPHRLGFDGAPVWALLDKTVCTCHIGKCKV